MGSSSPIFRDENYKNIWNQHLEMVVVNFLLDEDGKALRFGRFHEPTNIKKCGVARLPRTNWIVRSGCVLVDFEPPIWNIVFSNWIFSQGVIQGTKIVETT